MTQFEYEKQMNELNTACYAETEQLREQLYEIGTKQSETKKEILELKAYNMALGIQYQHICEQIRCVKERYNKKKHEVYVNRPDKEECKTA